jgi:hypothetical protein
MDDEARKEILRQRSRRWRLFYKLNGPTIQRTEKICYRCKQLKPIDEFPINRDKPDWRGKNCKPCNDAVKEAWRQANPEKARAAGRRKANRRKSLPNDERLKYQRKWYANHKAEQYKHSLNWRNKNRAKFNAYMVAYHKRRMASNPQYAFAYKIRSRVRLLLSGHRKSAPTEQLLGCKIADFKKYLESQWEPWMSWDNYGNKEGNWCIDHIVPVDAFNLDDPNDQRACFHFSNLRPLCRTKNRDKWHKFDPADLEALRQRVNRNNL